MLWPLLWLAGAVSAWPHLGLFGPMAIALATVSLGLRLRRALLDNVRYRFTTWRWGRVLTVLAIIGAVLRLTASA